MPPVVIGPRWLSRHDESPTGAGQYGRYDTRLRDELPEELLKPLGNLRKSTFSRCLRCGGCWAGSPPRRSFQRIARTGPPDAPPSVRLLGRDLTPARLSGDIWTLAPSPGAIRTLPRLSGDIWTLPPLSGYIWTFSSLRTYESRPRKASHLQGFLVQEMGDGSLQHAAPILALYRSID